MTQDPFHETSEHHELASETTYVFHSVDAKHAQLKLQQHRQNPGFHLCIKFAALSEKESNEVGTTCDENGTRGKSGVLVNVQPRV